MLDWWGDDYAVTYVWAFSNKDDGIFIQNVPILTGNTLTFSVPKTATTIVLARCMTDTTEEEVWIPYNEETHEGYLYNQSADLSLVNGNTVAYVGK